MLSGTATRAAALQSWPVLGLAGLLLLVVTAVAGLYVGNRWAEGTQAIGQRKQQQTYIDQLQAEAEQLREIAANAALDYAAAADRQEAIATELENDRETNRKHAAAQHAALEKLLASRPDLRTDRAGADVLQHWNRANQGPAAAGAAPGTGTEPDAAVPAAAGGNVGPVGGVDRQPRPGGSAVPRVRGRQSAAGASGDGMAAHGMGLVLPGAGADAAAGLRR